MEHTTKHQKSLQLLFEKWANEKAHSFIPVAGSGSGRQYYRIKGNSKQAIGVYHSEEKENAAFVSFTNTFLQLKLPVPQIYAVSLPEHIYLLQDLGDVSLFTKVQALQGKKLPENTKKLYKESLRGLLKFQIPAADKIDYSLCHPRNSMDKQSFMWDLNYFKYFFLKTQGVSFEEDKLENDFQALSTYLSEAGQDFFLYRDFQARNILIHNNKPYFIDYQGGRKGALQYDLASLLFQAKAGLNAADREELLEFYIEEAAKHTTINKTNFLNYYYPFVLIRLLQVLGAYGFRGLIEKKNHFIESIPPAMDNIEWFQKNIQLPLKLPELNNCLNRLILLYTNKKIKIKTPALQVHINSFAYKQGIPKDKSGHGEGFVFDCRALPNPGRLKQYKRLNGSDREIAVFLEKHREPLLFLDNVYQIVSQSIDNYLKRDFSILTVNFGCTGGQHRSVYCAESLAKYLKKKYNIIYKLTHHAKSNWNTKQ